MATLPQIVTFEEVPYSRLMTDEWKPFVAEVCASLLVIENQIKKHKEGKIIIYKNYTVKIKNIPDQDLQARICTLIKKVNPKLIMYSG